ncbi:MAG: iron ABC transporter permease [Bacteroidota bacterium]
MGDSWLASVFQKKWLGLFLGLSMLVALFIGAYSLSIAEIWKIVTLESEGAQQFLLINIRLPRILLAAITGAGLAISGAAIQGLFRNPLADQTLIGVTSGAMLFAVLSIVFLGSLVAKYSVFLEQISVSVFAFIGGFLTTYLVYFLSRREGKTYVMTMLLAGIAISAFAGAITGLIIYLSDDQQLRDITFWSMGSFSGANWVQVGISGPIIFGGIYLLSRYSRALNAFLLGEQEALYLGISVEQVKSRIILLTALIVGICISMSGIIGFVGLVIPHLLRLIKGSDHRYLLVASAIVGALFLVFADTIARTIIAPAELPIGILTAVVGAPFFLWLLIQSYKNRMLA